MPDSLHGRSEYMLPIEAPAFTHACAALLAEPASGVRAFEGDRAKHDGDQQPVLPLERSDSPVFFD